MKGFWGGGGFATGSVDGSGGGFAAGSACGFAAVGADSVSGVAK